MSRSIDLFNNKWPNGYLLRLEAGQYWNRKYPLRITILNLSHMQTSDLHKTLNFEILNFGLRLQYGKAEEGWVERYNREHGNKGRV